MPSTEHRILIIEDDCAIRETLAEILEGEGYEVSRACNGAEALARLKSSAGTRLILLDLMMPVMDGWEFRNEQREDPAIRGIPVVVISADHALDRKASELQAQGFLPKPFQVERLLETVRHYC